LVESRPSIVSQIRAPPHMSPAGPISISSDVMCGQKAGHG
jgi:hypothetical protein